MLRLTLASRSTAFGVFCWLVAGAASLTLGTNPAKAQTQTVNIGKMPGGEWINSAAPFWRDSLLDVHGRTYYLKRDNFNGSIAEAWAGGGWLAWQSGFIHDVLQVGAAFYASVPIYAPEGRDGTLLLAPGQEPIFTLGQAWVLKKIAGQSLTLGLQLVDTPLINPRDNRMIPITFGGITLKGSPNPMWSYWAGYLFDYKPRDLPTFQSMASGLGVHEDIGAWFGLVRLEPMNGWHFAFEDYFIQDTINSGYGEARYDFPHATNAAAWTFAINDIFQTSVGSDLITGDSFATHQASAKLGVSQESWTLFLAASTTGTGADIRSPFGSKPNYTDMQQLSYDRAGEDAVVIGAAYDFTMLGGAGWTAGAVFGHGWDAINPFTGAGLPDRSEYDLYLQFRPKTGRFQGLRLQAKYANVFGDGLGVRGNQPELRLIADYSLQFKR